MAIVLVLLVVHEALAVLPLRDQWRAGARALAAGDAVGALALFREFDHWYGGEEAVREPEFREGLLRLWGLAAMEAGQWEEAARLLEAWLSENPPGTRFGAFLRFQLGGIHEALGNTEEARAHQEAFLEQHPELPETLLIRWRWAEAALSEGRTAEAGHELRKILESAVLPESGRALAASALAMVELAAGRRDTALELLGQTSGSRGEPVVRFWRAIVAPALAHQLLAADQPEEALEAARWFDRQSGLKARLEKFAERFRRRAESHRRAGHVRQTIWNTHWQGRLSQLERSLEEERMAGPETLYAIRLKALIEAGELRPALILATALVRSGDAIDGKLRATAYREAIEACLKLRIRDRAESLIRDFEAAHPDDPALPDIRFMAARTAAARADWRRAVRNATRLMEAHPDHPAWNTWAALRGDWLLRCGEAAAALQQFRELEETVPEAWHPFVRFQQGRCLASLHEWQEAVAVFSSVANRESASPALRESACTERLKLYLRHGDATAFNNLLKHYRDRHADGLQRLVVENLAGTFLLAQGREAEAIPVFGAVAAADRPEADFARRELSRLYRKNNDIEALRRLAIDWIRLTRGAGCPPEPFLDLLHCQDALRSPALPEGLGGSLLEGMLSGNSPVPAAPFLDLLAGEWAHYRKGLGLEDVPIDEWVDSRAREAYGDAAWRPFTLFELYAASRLERAGRTDSADARKIRVLQNVDPALLGEAEAFTVAATAQAYDFPGAGDRLRAFLSRFPDTKRRPEALLFLAQRLRRDGSGEARFHLGEIVRDWPDAKVYPQAALLLAEGEIADDRPAAALDVLDRLLGRSGLRPRRVAKALLLRVRADFMTDNPARGSANARRLLTLYPEFHDIVGEARAVLAEHGYQPGDSPEPGQPAERTPA